MQQVQDGGGLRDMAKTVAGDGYDEVWHLVDCFRYLATELSGVLFCSGLAANQAVSLH